MGIRLSPTNTGTWSHSAVWSAQRPVKAEVEGSNPSGTAGSLDSRVAQLGSLPDSLDGGTDRWHRGKDPGLWLLSRS